jgi:hypothetical protein
MMENTPEDTTTEAQVPESPASEYKAQAPAGTEGTGRYAVYDLTLERYVGEVSDSKPSAKDAKALTHSGSYAIVEV